MMSAQSVQSAPLQVVQSVQPEVIVMSVPLQSVQPEVVVMSVPLQSVQPEVVVMREPLQPEEHPETAQQLLEMLL